MEATLGGIILEQISEVIGRHDVANRDDVHVLAEQALLRDGAEHEATDTTESVNSNFDWHSFKLSFGKNCSTPNAYFSNAPQAVNEEFKAKREAKSKSMEMGAYILGL